MISFKSLLCAAALVSSATMAFAKAPLTLLTEEFPPYNYTENGEIVGSATDLIREALDAANVAYAMEVQPWARAFSTAQNTANTCVFSTSVTDERKPKFKWVTPLDENHIILVGRKSDGHVITSLDDARTLSIGTYNGDVTEDILKAEGMNIVSAPKEELNPKKLKAGRVDLWVTFRNRLQQENDPDLEEVYVVQSTMTGLACNLDVDDATIATIQSSLDHLIAAGRAEEINGLYKN